MKNARAVIAAHPVAFLLITNVATVCGLGVAKGWFADPSAPAWVQAYGSIGAILGAIWIARQEASRQHSAALRADIQRLKTVVYVSEQLLKAIAAGTDDIDRLELKFASSNFDSVVEALVEIRITDLPFEEVAVAVINQRRNARFFREALDLAQEQGRSLRGVEARLETLRALGDMELLAEGALGASENQREAIGTAIDLCRGEMAKHAKSALDFHHGIVGALEATQRASGNRLR